MTKLDADIDIDFSDRNAILSKIKYISASIEKDNVFRKHNTGIYVTDIPYDPVNNIASIDYKQAENRGYFKIDLLNAHIYSEIRDEQHLLSLMKDPEWSRFYDYDFFKNLAHIGNHYDVLIKMPEPVNSITRLAMFIALIRPGKRHLIGLTWKEIAKTIWEKTNDGYYFRQSHSCAYAHLVAVHANLIVEKLKTIS